MHNLTARLNKRKARVLAPLMLGALLLAGQSAAQATEEAVFFDFRSGTQSGKTLNFKADGVNVEVSGASYRMATKPDAAVSAIRTISGLGIASVSDWDTFGLGTTTVNWSFTGPGETLFLTFDRPVDLNYIRLGGQQLAQLFPTTTTVMYAVDPQTNKRIGDIQPMNTWFNGSQMLHIGEFGFNTKGKLPTSRRFAITGVLGVDHLDTMTIVQTLFVIPRGCPKECPQLTISKNSNGPWEALSTKTPDDAVLPMSAAGPNYTLTVRNRSSAATFGTVTVRDLLPDGVKPMQPTIDSNGWNCSTVAQLVTCSTKQVIAAGASSNIVIPVTLAEGVTGSLTNKASVGGGGDPDPIPDPANCLPGSLNVADQCASHTTSINVTTTKQPTPKLSISKSGNGPWENLERDGLVPMSVASAGDSKFEYRITVSNTGTVATAGTITLRDLMPKGVLPLQASFSSGTWSCDRQDQLLTCTSSEVLAPAASTTLTIPVKLSAGVEGSVTNKAVVGGGGDPDAMPDPATCMASASEQCAAYTTQVSVPVRAVRLSISKSSNGPWLAASTAPAPMAARTVATQPAYTLSVRNEGESTTSSSVMVKDMLPLGVSPVQPTFESNGWNCTTSGQLVSCTTPVLAAGVESKIVIPVQLDSRLQGEVINKASVGGGGDPDPMPNPLDCTANSMNEQCAYHSTSVVQEMAPTRTSSPMNADDVLSTMSLAGECRNIYALVARGTQGLDRFAGGFIHRLNENLNTYSTDRIALPSNVSSAALAVSSDGQRFFTISDANNQMYVYDTTTSRWTAGGTFSNMPATGANNTENRMIRMTVAKNGKGYAMDAAGNMWTFATTAPYGVTAPRRVQPSRTSPAGRNFNENGDMFAGNDGKIYILSSLTNSTDIDLWTIDPDFNAYIAEFTGSFKDATQSASADLKYGGFALSADGKGYGSNTAGNLIQVDTGNLAYKRVGGTASVGTTDLASCVFADLKPNLNIRKDVKKVAGFEGDTIRAGDEVEYTITIRNDGSLSAGGAVFLDPLPAGLSYVADSARINGFASTFTNGVNTNLAGANYPFAQPVGICSKGTAACKDQVLAIDNTPSTTDKEAVITFRAKVNAGFSGSISNVGYTKSATSPEISDDAVISVDGNLPQLTIAKRSNATAGKWTYDEAAPVYVLTVANKGSVATNGLITVQDQLPKELSVASASGFSPASGWTCTYAAGNAGQLLNCTSSASLAAGTNVELRIPVKIALTTAGNLVNKASVGGGGDPDPLPNPATCTPVANGDGQCAEHVVTLGPVTSGAVPCNELYGLGTTPASELGLRDYGIEVYGTFIRRLNINTNTFEGPRINLPVINGKQSVSATLAVTPNGEKFFVVTDDTVLRVFDNATGLWASGGKFDGVGTDITQNRMIRMGITPDGVGYAMDSEEGRLWSFQTTAPYAVKNLGIIKPSDATAPALSRNGDLFAALDGKIYMLSSPDGANKMDLWVMNPATNVLVAEYLGRLDDNSGIKPQFGGFAALPYLDAVFGSDGAGRLTRINIFGKRFEFVGGNNGGTTDLTSCYYPDFRPVLEAKKKVENISNPSATEGYPGDILRYTITVTNKGNIYAGGALFNDPLPKGVTYIADSARINGFTTTVLNGKTINLAGPAYPFASNVGICTKNGEACKNQVLDISGSAEITFDVRINDPFTNPDSKVTNIAYVTFPDSPITPTVPPTVTPVNKPVKVVARKTVQNITMAGPVTTSNEGKAGDVLEYCITNTNEGSAYASEMIFVDNAPPEVIFQTGSYGAGKDIRVQTPNAENFYTAAQDSDAGSVIGRQVKVNMGDFILQPRESFKVCFRGTIR